MSATSVNECYQLGLSVKDYDHKHWLTEVMEVMYDIQKLKYTQNPKYMDVLGNLKSLKLLPKTKHGV